MTIDGIHHTIGIADPCHTSAIEDSQQISRWNGRDVSLITCSDTHFFSDTVHSSIFRPPLITPTTLLLLSAIELLVFDTDDEEGDLPSDFAFAPNYPLLDPMELSKLHPQLHAYLERTGLLKRLWKGIRKGAKKVAKVFKKAGEEIEHAGKKIAHGTKKASDFIKDHKKEALITLAVMASIVGGLLLAGALGNAATVSASTSKKKEEEPDETPPGSEPPPVDPHVQASIDLANQFLNAIGAIWLEELQSSLSSEGAQSTTPFTTPVDPMETLRKAEELLLSLQPKATPLPLTVFDGLFGKSPSSSQQTIFDSLEVQELLQYKPDIQGKCSYPFFTVPDLLKNSCEQTGPDLSASALFETHPPTPSQSPELTPPTSQYSRTAASPVSYETRIQQHGYQTIPDGGNLNSAIGTSASLTFNRELKKKGDAQERVDPFESVSANDTSCRFQTHGRDLGDKRVVFINGINNTYDEAVRSATYLSSFYPVEQCQVNGIYNHSNSVVGDALEILLLNSIGISPNTKDLLQAEWTDFYNKNKDNPNAKLLHVCHSQGALHTKHALFNLPEEIRKRIVVVAVAPAVVISKKWCAESFNYASKRDFVPYFQAVLYTLGAIGQQDSNGDEEERITAFDLMNEMNWLDPHPDADPRFDHEFQSPTFQHLLEKHNREYQEGMY